jgi:hypothetical protein
MAYIGIGYSGEDASFLQMMVDEHAAWLQGDRLPHLIGDRFLLLYDSNTAREFARKCFDRAQGKKISCYPVGRPIELAD